VNKQQRVELAATLREAKRAYVQDKLVEAMGQFEYARAIYGEEAELDVNGETLADVLNMILACAQQLADWTTMAETSNALIALDPAECDPWIRLAIALKHTGDLPGSTKAVLHAIELDPDDSNARYEHACQLAVAGDTAAALERVAEAVDLGADPEALVADDELASLRELARFRELTSQEN
jgi:tetratricopeptide (TPR) repeat protein